jgi:hypothetical protein
MGIRVPVLGPLADFWESTNRQRPERGIFSRSHRVLCFCDCRKWPESEDAVNAPHIGIVGNAVLLYSLQYKQSVIRLGGDQTLVPDDQT